MCIYMLHIVICYHIIADDKVKFGHIAFSILKTSAYYLFIYLKIYFIEVYLDDSVVFLLYSVMTRVYICTYTYVFIFFPTVVYYRILNIVLCYTVGPCCYPFYV